MKINKLNIILEEIKTKKIVTVNELVEKLNVTRMTINRYLNYLNDQNLIIKTHGGAVINDTLKIDLAYIERRNINSKEKKYIAKIAANLINDGDIIFISPSTTNELILKYIGKKRIRVYTNSLYIFQTYKNNKNIELFLIGGYFRNSSGSFYGDITEKIIDFLNFDIAFFSANGILDNSVTILSKNESNLQNKIIKKSKQNYLLIDYTKFDQKKLYEISKLNKFTAVLTDYNTDKKYINHYIKFTKIINNIK